MTRTRSSLSYQRAEVLEKHKAVKAERKKVGLPVFEGGGLGSPTGMPIWLDPLDFGLRFGEVLATIDNHGYCPEGWPGIRHAYRDQYRKMGVMARDEQFNENDGSRGLIYRVTAALLGYQFALLQEQSVEVPDHPIAVMPDGCYGPFLEAVEDAGGEAILVPCDAEHNYFQGVRAVLESGMKVSMVFVNSFHNPSGVGCTPEELEWLVEEANERNFLILSDRTYSELAFPGIGTPQLSIFNVPGAWEVAYEIFTLSKIYNIARWRIGGGLGRKKFVRMVDQVKSKHGYGLSLLAEIAGHIIITNYSHSVGEQAKRFAERAHLWASYLPGAQVPPGGMFLWYDVTHILRALRIDDSAELCDHIMKTTGVEWWSGLGFATPKQGQTKVRISLGQPLDAIHAGAEQLIRGGIISRDDQGSSGWQLIKA